eukprot:m.354981 g.354981  ORF g.354981 m.354981 type:complete len:56 (+) comp17149_c0_seq1:142-309(+)
MADNFSQKAERADKIERREKDANPGRPLKRQHPQKESGAHVLNDQLNPIHLTGKK